MCEICPIRLVWSNQRSYATCSILRNQKCELYSLKKAAARGSNPRWGILLFFSCIVHNIRTILWEIRRSVFFDRNQLFKNNTSVQNCTLLEVKSCSFRNEQDVNLTPYKNSTSFQLLIPSHPIPTALPYAAKKLFRAPAMSRSTDR
jgi:hypothetical protein